MYRLINLWNQAKFNWRLCTGQIEASTPTPPPPPGISRAFDSASCQGRREFERCLGRVGNLNQIYLLFWHVACDFFWFLPGLTDFPDRILPLLVNNSFKRSSLKKFEGVIMAYFSLKSVNSV